MLKKFTEFLMEKAPPSKEAEEWIKKNKENFKDQYGDDWEKILYAKAWKMFGEGIDEKVWYDKLVSMAARNVFAKEDYKDALKTLVSVLDRKRKAGNLGHDVVYYATSIAKSYANVDGQELADMYKEVFSESVDESEAPTNTTSGVDNPDGAPLFKKSKFAGYPCVEVDGSTYVKCSRGKGKKPYARWKQYVDDDELETFVKKNYQKEKRLLMKNRDTGAMTFIK